MSYTEPVEAFAMRIGRATALVITALCSPVPSHAQQSEKAFNIRLAHAKCLLNNEARYAGVQRDPAILFLSLCPDVDPTPREIARLNQNQYFMKVRVRDDREIRTVVMIPRRHLGCFLKQVRTRSTKSAANLVPIDLGLCR